MDEEKYLEAILNELLEVGSADLDRYFRNYLDLSPERAAELGISLVYYPAEDKMSFDFGLTRGDKAVKVASLTFIYVKSETGDKVSSNLTTFIDSYVELMKELEC